jgi:hypothetical protein
MAGKKVLYEDVVVGNNTNLPPQPRSDTKPTTADPEEDPVNSERQAGNSSKKRGKDEKPQPAMEKRAEKMAEDPFMTPAEMKNMDGDTKEKEKKAENTSREDTRKEEAKETKKDLDIIASRAEKILFKARSLFPFDFFPNTITIDANKVNIIISTFFFTETVTSILLKEIMDVRVETTLFLGKLIIDYGPHPLKISTVYVPSLWKSDALRAKEIIEGVLVLYRSENIDTTRLKPEETLDEIQEVGKVDEERH